MSGAAKEKTDTKKPESYTRDELERRAPRRSFLPDEINWSLLVRDDEMDEMDGEVALEALERMGYHFIERAPVHLSIEGAWSFPLDGEFDQKEAEEAGRLIRAVLIQKVSAVYLRPF